VASTVDAQSCDLTCTSVIVIPTEEKSRSDCTEIAAMANRRRATDGEYWVVVGPLSSVSSEHLRFMFLVPSLFFFVWFRAAD